MTNRRKPYPSDVTDDEWNFCVPYLTLMQEDAPQREYAFRGLFNGLHWLIRTGQSVADDAACFNPRRTAARERVLTERKTQAQQGACRGGHAGTFARAESHSRQSTGSRTGGGTGVRGATGHWPSGGTGVYVDQGYTGERAAAGAQEHGTQLEVVKLPKPRQGQKQFVL